MLNDTHLRKFEDYKSELLGRYGQDTYESWFKPLSLDDYEQERVVLCAPSKFAAREICERFSEDMVEIWKEKCGPVRAFLVRGGKGGSTSSVPVRTSRSKPGTLNGAGALAGRSFANKGLANRQIARAEQQMADRRALTKADMTKTDMAKPEAAKSEAVTPVKAARLAPVVKLETKPQPARPEAANQPAEAETGHIGIASPLNATMSFDRFCLSDSNRMAATAAMELFERHNEGILYLHGGPGRGKTHLLNAIGLDWLARRAGDRVLYLPYDNLLNGYVSAVVSKTLPDFRAYLDNVDLLLVDDVHLLRGRKATQEELMTLLDRLVTKGKAVAVAGSMAPSSLAETGLNHRLTDRLAGGLSVPVDKPDFNLRLRILRQMAETDRANGRVFVEERFVQMIARRCDASIREIEGAYRAIRLKAETNQRSSYPVEVSDAHVEGVLSEILRYRRKEVTLDDLLAAVADAFGLTVADLRSRRRPQAIVKGRHAFCMLARKLTQAPLKEVGACLNRDHTTVLSSLERGEVLAETDPVFGERISRLMDEFGE